MEITWRVTGREGEGKEWEQRSINDRYKTERGRLKIGTKQVQNKQREYGTWRSQRTYMYDPWT